MWYKFRFIVFCLSSAAILLGINRYKSSDRFRTNKLELIQKDLNNNFYFTKSLISFATSYEHTGYKLAQKGIKYIVSQHQEIVYWNETNVKFEPRPKNEFIEIEDQTYYAYSIPLKGCTHQFYIPIHSILSSKNHFPETRSIVHAPDKKSHTSVALITNLYISLQWIVLFFYLLFVYSGLKIIFQWSHWFRSKGKIINGMIGFTVGIFLVRLCSLALIQDLRLTAISLFNGNEKPSLLSPTLGDLIINICILCILVWFVRNYVKPAYFTKDKSQGFLIAALNYGLVFISALLMVQIYRQMVIGSGLSFDFEYIFYLDIKSFIALIGILVLAISLFLLDLHLLRIIRHLGLSAKSRFMSNVIAMLCVITIGYFIPLQFPISVYIGLAGYLALLDISIDYYKANASWYLVWTLTGSIFISSLLYQFHIERELIQKNTIVQTLTTELLKTGSRPEESQLSILRNELKKFKNHSSYEVQKIRWNGTGQIPAHYFPINSSGFYLVKYSNPLFKVFSFFSYIFVLFNLLLILLHILNNKIKWMSISIIQFFPTKHTLRYRIQSSILYMSIGSFILIASVITLYIKYHSNTWNQQNPFLSQLHTQNLDLQTQSVYTKEGLVLPELTYRMDYSDWQQRFIPGSLISTSTSKGETYFYKPSPEYISAQTKRRLNDLLGTLLNVYVFLLIAMIIMSFVVSNSIVKPLTLLSSKLKQIQVGGSNQRLEWNNQDELGGLIRNYNAMIQELDRSTRMLALTERETAWREMAKQVAHEIKNPLTPMKLITQHLQNSIGRAEPEEIPALVKRVTQTLIEQIENLSKIASEFSNFAKLPAPENAKIIMNEVVTSTHDLFRKREDMDIHLRVPIDEIYIFADKNHIIRVLTNLLKNAIQAIPLGRRGRIEIILYKQNEKAIVKIADNGCGIPDTMKDKVFYPNFTTKNSGTGLGLAIVRDIVDSCNGHIYFNTVENKGTEFYIELPLMHMEDNFKEERRVSL